MVGANVVLAGLCILAARPIVNDSAKGESGLELRTLAAQLPVDGMEDYVPLLQDTIAKVGAGNVDEAVKLFFPVVGAAPGDPEPEPMRMFRKQLTEMHKASGGFEGSDIVAVRRISSRVHTVYAIAYFERQPIMFRFGMYRWNKTWRFTECHFNRDMTELQQNTPMIPVSLQGGK